MDAQETSLPALTAARARLVRELPASLDGGERHFLRKHDRRKFDAQADALDEKLGALA